MKYLLTIVFLLSINSLSAKVEECVKIKDDTARLECFDSLFLDKKDIEEANEVIIEQEEKLAIENESYEQRNFGLSIKQRKKDPEEELKINSKILSVSQKLNFQLIIILENGQIWQSVEKIRDIRLRDGFEVEITEGFLSGYTLRVPGKKIKIRVRRQK
tara:strand:- start:1810 stop:2286 length:477 start_codon:yes stop_codon:yes gene_type:complete